MFPNMNPRQVEQAMKKLGVKQVEIDASEVIIKCSDKTLVVRDPHVVKVNMMGQESLQITGEITEEASMSADDVATVAAQAHVSAEEARHALEEARGDLAEAILALQKKHG